MAKNFRSAITGEYVKESFAKKNPKTTVGEKRSSPKGKNGKRK